MFGQLFQVLDIVGYELWRAVMVLEQRDNLPPHQSVGAAETEEDAEQERNDVVDSEVEEGLDGAYERLAALLGCALAAVAECLLPLCLLLAIRRLRGKKRLQEFFALLDRELLASPKSGFLLGSQACGSHCGRCEGVERQNELGSRCLSMDNKAVKSQGKERNNARVSWPYLADVR